MGQARTGKRTRSAPVRGRDFGRVRHDPARRAEFLPQFAARFAAALEFGILLCAVIAVTLNALFDRIGSSPTAKADAATVAASAQHM
jgi:hypothetical protein